MKIFQIYETKNLCETKIREKHYINLGVKVINNYEENKVKWLSHRYASSQTD